MRKTVFENRNIFAFFYNAQLSNNTKCSNYMILYIILSLCVYYDLYGLNLFNVQGSVGKWAVVEHDEAQNRGRIPERFNRVPSFLLRETDRILLAAGPTQNM